MLRRTYIGVDPGARGALALMHGERVHVFDAPMILEKRGKSRKPVTDCAGLARLVTMLADMQPELVAIERVWGVIGQSASTGAALGHARACLEQAFWSAGIRPRLVSPQRWKADLGLYNKPGSAALEKAMQLFPHDAAAFKTIRGVRNTEACIGRADAALIAWHAARFAPAGAKC